MGTGTGRLPFDAAAKAMFDGMEEALFFSTLRAALNGVAFWNNRHNARLVNGQQRSVLWERISCVF